MTGMTQGGKESSVKDFGFLRAEFCRVDAADLLGVWSDLALIDLLGVV